MTTLDDAPESYRRGYERLDTTVLTVAGNTTTQCRPAVLGFPTDADLTAQAVHDAVAEGEFMITSPFIEDKDEGFYYSSSRLYRPDAEPDIEIRADANALRLFETPYDATEPLPALSFDDFAAIIGQIETELDLTFQPYADG